MLNYIALLGLLALVAPQQVNSVGTEPGENAHEFGVFCRLAEIAGETRPPAEEDESLNTTKLLQDLHHFELLTSKSTDTRGDETWLRRNGLENASFPEAPDAKNFATARRMAERLTAPCLTKEGKTSKIREVVELLKKGVLGSAASQDTDVAHPNGIEKTGVFGDTASSGSNYGNSCTGKTGPGKTLVNDIFCLCVGKSSGNTNDVCVDNVKLPVGGGNWPLAYVNGSAQQADFPDSWKAIYAKCPRTRRQLTSRNIKVSVEAFVNLLGAGSGGTSFNQQAKAPYIYGTITTKANDCTGASGQNVCVDYSARVAGDGKENNIENIPWVQQYLQAAQKLEDLEKLESECKQNTQQIAILHFSTVALFNQTVRELQREDKPNQPGQLQTRKPATSVEKVTSQESDAVNTASIIRFILPWTLLI